TRAPRLCDPPPPNGNGDAHRTWESRVLCPWHRAPAGTVTDLFYLSRLLGAGAGRLTANSDAKRPAWLVAQAGRDVALLPNGSQLPTERTHLCRCVQHRNPSHGTSARRASTQPSRNAPACATRARRTCSSS